MKTLMAVIALLGACSPASENDGPVNQIQQALSSYTTPYRYVGIDFYVTLVTGCSAVGGGTCATVGDAYVIWRNRSTNDCTLNHIGPSPLGTDVQITTWPSGYSYGMVLAASESGSISCNGINPGSLTIAALDQGGSLDGSGRLIPGTGHVINVQGTGGPDLIDCSGWRGTVNCDGGSGGPDSVWNWGAPDHEVNYTGYHASNSFWKYNNSDSGARDTVQLGYGNDCVSVPYGDGTTIDCSGGTDLYTGKGGNACETHTMGMCQVLARGMP